MNHEALWNTRYRDAGDDYLFGIEPSHFMARRAHLFEEGHSALSVADGEGRNSVWLAEQGLKVTAVEISPIAVAKARKLAAGRSVEVHFLVADLLAPEWPPAEMENSFDWVVGIFIQFAGPDERRRQFASMKRATRPGGRILLHGYTPRQLEYKTGGPPHAENMYTPDLLRAAFPGWYMEQMAEYDDDIAEGAGHRGRSALIGMVARKQQD
ncbi:MAG: class I SAM-dependent methyltransferase [Proteobacteria bacterium]|nr:class I SAM-dependent methyltransferase [Pseudomonadota bacterium]